MENNSQSEPIFGYERMMRFRRLLDEILSLSRDIAESLGEREPLLGDYIARYLEWLEIYDPSEAPDSWLGLPVTPHALRYNEKPDNERSLRLLYSYLAPYADEEKLRDLNALLRRAFLPVRAINAMWDRTAAMLTGESL